ncbi:acyl-CoA dehydrogenase family protein [Venturia nashicola]|uniref:Acyl-CoA dehydrogenase family protein n=1 Tax=Venturia nashicola TaxID=86259 RepID=A0A4Z1PG84_9PEZI|nr:acyl-CoA dehydrogenase family protein [Venturia nashicola]TLD32273.1 acyl-CoA dehydrogenase family protein [Venturia nashicola]
MPFQVPALVASRVSAKAKDLLTKVDKFVEEECIPSERVFAAQQASFEKRFGGEPAVMFELQEKAKQLGLWNTFLHRKWYTEGAGFNNVEYILLAGILGRSPLAGEAINCAPPEDANMELLALYGTPQQKKDYLVGMLDGSVRSAILNTEKEVAASEWFNLAMTGVQEGNELVLNGAKWFGSGVGHPRCKFFVVSVKTDPNNPDPLKQQSMVLVPKDTPGVKVERMVSNFGFDNAPRGFGGEITFKNARVPISSVILGLGRAFEIHGSRNPLAKIYHAGRCLGGAERALEMMIARVNDPARKIGGKLISQFDIIMEWVARSRMEIDAARLITLNAAMKVDDTDGTIGKGAEVEITQAKIMGPATVLKVLDRAIQAHGGLGVTQDVILTQMYSEFRTMRIVIGPDEVQLVQMGRDVNERSQACLGQVEEQKKRAEQKLKENGFRVY